MNDALGLIGLAVIGTLGAGVLALIPALHIYNVVGLLLLSATALSGVLNADQIIVLEKGVIVARGTHEELIEASELYAQIYSSQLLEDVHLDAQTVEAAQVA